MSLSMLHAGDLTVLGRLIDASNATLLCEIQTEEPSKKIKAIYKPIAGERPLWDFPDVELAYREVAAYVLSEALGLNVVPETVLRDGPFGIGSVQRWVEIDESLDVVQIALSEHEDIRKMVLLDVLMNNTDRKYGHILPDSNGRIFGCDHGLTFHVDDKLRTVLWQYAGSALSEEELSLVANLVAQDLSEIFKGLLSEEEITALACRAVRLKDSGTFPYPSDEWPSIPWPPF